MDIIAEGNGYRVRLEWDQCAPDPRTEFDNYGADEVQAWQDGDVWGYVVEQAATWVRLDADGAGESRSSWELIESVWGFYGRTWAEQCAREALSGFAGPAVLA